MSHQCQQEQLFDMITKRLDTIDRKLDNILAYKWSIVGGAAVVAAFVSAIGWIVKGV